MSVIKNQSKKESDRKSILTVGGIIVIVSTLLFAYLMWYVTPEENIESVRIVAVTEAGCIGETYDGYPVNIGECNASPGEFLNALVDQKTKERAALMNPTS